MIVGETLHEREALHDTSLKRDTSSHATSCIIKFVSPSLCHQVCIIKRFARLRSVVRLVFSINQHWLAPKASLPPLRAALLAQHAYTRHAQALPARKDRIVCASSAKPRIPTPP